MRQQIERIKGIVLAGLVAMSIFLSVSLWTNTPVFESLDQGGYIVNPAFGPGKSVDQVLLPIQVQARSEDNQYVQLLPFTQFQSKALAELHKLAVRDLFPIENPEAVDKSIRASRFIRFQFGLLLNEDQINQMIKLVDPLSYRMQVSSIIVYRDNQGLGSVVLADEDRLLFQGRIDGQSKLFEQMPLWTSLPRYEERSSSQGSLFVAKEKQAVPVPTFERLVIPAETLARSFFVDPTLTRKIRERNGSLMLTDGNRIVQIPAQGKGIRYSSPNPMERKQEIELKDSSFQRAVAFINEHGGMQGAYVGVLEKKWGQQSRAYTFVEYYNGIPILPEFTGIHLTLIGNEVVELTRNVLYLGSEIKEKTVEIQPPNREWIEQARNVQLSYAPKAVNGNQIQLNPVWVVQQKQTSIQIYDAQTGEKWKDTGEWENGLE